MTIQPLAGYVLIKDKDFELAGGFIIPETNSDQRVIGEVTAVGGDTEKKKCPVEVGDVIVYKKYSKDDFAIQGKPYRLVRFEDLVAIVKEDK